MKLTLKIRQKDQEILVKELGEGVYRIGRSEFCDIALPSEKISRTHLELRVTELSVYLTNMSTSGKVKVNRELIETCELHDGDEVQVGPYRMEILLNSAGAVAEPAAAEPQADVPFNENNSNVIEGGFKKEGQPQEPAFDGNLALAVESPAADLMVNERNSSVKYKNDTQVEAKPLVAKILFQTGPKQGQECSIEGFEVVLGRSKRADIQVEDNKLSRLHCKIFRVGMGYRLMDLQSKRGTYVNGVRVLEHPLASFDEVEIGDTKFKFLVHDMVMGNPVGGPLAAVGDTLAGTRPAITKSLALGAINPELIDELKNQGPDPYLPQPGFEPVARTSILSQVSQRTKVLALVVIGLLALYLLMPDSSKTKKAETVENKATMEDKLSKIELPPSLPKEYGELSEEVQRAIEGQYHSAQSAAEQGRYEEAVAYLKQIHENLPFYKQSRELLDQFSQKLREKQIAEAQEKAKKDEKQDLAIYLEDGLAYLKEGEFEKASEVFNSAIVLDPTNPIAVKGLKAAELKIRDIEAIPPERDPEDEKRKLVTDLFQKAIVAFSNKS